MVLGGLSHSYKQKSEYICIKENVHGRIENCINIRIYSNIQIVFRLYDPHHKLLIILLPDHLHHKLTTEESMVKNVKLTELADDDHDY